MQRKQRLQDFAYILHSRPYRNTSLIVEAFTREHGRISIVARGAKRGQHSLASILQPFSPLFLHWGGAGDMQTLYHAESAPAGYKPIRIDFYSGFYLNELMLRLLHRHDPHPGLYDSYAHCLAELGDKQTQDIPLRYFELALLEELGYAMNLLVDVTSGGNVHPDEHYHYVLEQGPAPAQSTSGDLLAVRGATLIALADRALMSTEQRNEAKHLLRTVIDHYLDHRPLKTRELLQNKKLLLACQSSS